MRKQVIGSLLAVMLIALVTTFVRLQRPLQSIYTTFPGMMPLTRWNESARILTSNPLSNIWHTSNTENQSYILVSENSGQALHQLSEISIFEAPDANRSQTQSEIQVEIIIPQTTPAAKERIPIPKANIHVPNFGVHDYQLYNGNDYTLEIFSDGTFHGVDSSSAKCKLALLVEPPCIDGNMYSAFKNPDMHKKFNRILTFNMELLSISDHFIKAYFGGSTVLTENQSLATNDQYWTESVKESYFQDKVKAKQQDGISIILSNKRSARGHRHRHDVLAGVPGLIGFGSGANNPIPSKVIGLEPYRYTIVIENDMDQGWYFSEKLLDPMLLATVPIYWSKGTYIKDLFDIRGIILFETVDELKIIINGLDQKAKYQELLPYLRKNFEVALNFRDPHTYRHLTPEYLKDACRL